MNKLSLILIFAITTSVQAAESAENLATQFSVRPLREQKMENLPVGREQEVIETLARLGDIDVLLRLNHKPTVERVMTKFLDAEGKMPALRGSIEASGSPYIIAELAPALYKNDRIQPRLYGEGTNDYGESAQAAEIIGQLIIRAPEFPPEVKEWAKKHLGGPGRDIIQAGRAWWELNQAVLLANQFDKVQVPASYPAGVMPEEPTQQLAAPPAAIEPTPEPPAPVAPPSESTPAKDPTSATKTNPAWWIIGLIALAASTVFVTRKNKPKD